jgi:hypothetical protein
MRRGGSARRAGSTASQLGEGSARRGTRLQCSCTDAPQRCIGRRAVRDYRTPGIRARKDAVQCG